MRRLLFVSVALLSGTPALAEPLLGLWLTRPDKKGQVAHVEAARCGPAICGTILRTYDKAGQPVVTPNLGKRIFWDMVPTGPGTYRGTGWLPLRNLSFGADLTVSRGTLTVHGCIGPVCQSQVWTRIGG